MPGSREKDFERNNAFPLYDLYGHTLAKEPCPRGHEIYKFSRPFPGHHYYQLGLSEPCSWVEKASTPYCDLFCYKKLRRRGKNWKIPAFWFSNFRRWAVGWECVWRLKMCFLGMSFFFWAGDRGTLYCKTLYTISQSLWIHWLEQCLITYFE